MPETNARPTRVTFPNGKTASLVVAPEDAEATLLLQTLGITTPPMVMMLFGGANSLDEGTAGRLRDTLRNAILPAIASRHGLIIDGGTNAGVMAIVGEEVARMLERPVLLGVAPRGKAKYPGGPDLSAVPDAADLEPNHGQFVLSPTDDWGSEIDVMFDMAESLAAHCPVTAVTAGGGEHTKAEVMRASRNGWPVVVLEGSGGFSEKLTNLSDPDVRHIAAEADLRTFPVGGDAATFEEILDTRRDGRKKAAEPNE
jgi:SLOG in TRPM, prokaryote